jgi:serine/threonine protein kinase
MRFGKYELLSRLGAGGMGEVWRARDHDLHRDVALKFLPERFASDTSRLGRFAQEARSASSLNHPTRSRASSLAGLRADPRFPPGSAPPRPPSQ